VSCCALATAKDVVHSKVPRQPEFQVVSELSGLARLADGAMVHTRIILADLVVYKEDLMGPQLAVNPVMALRVVPTSDFIEKVKDRPMIPLGESVPVSPEQGYEKIELAEILKPTISTYEFENSRLSLNVEFQSAARTLNYKTIAGGPPYNLRWTVIPKLEAHKLK
jgi:hypothetical protein